jgi:hypothetical protein
MAGLAVSMLGWGLYAYDETLRHGTAQFWTVRELAIATAGVGVPVFMIGVVVLMLGNSRMTRVSIGGLVACLVAVMVFVSTYPDAWATPGPDASVAGTGLYALGVLALTFACGAAYSCRVT